MLKSIEMDFEPKPIAHEFVRSNLNPDSYVICSFHTPVRKKILLLCGFPTENMRSTLFSWVHVGIVDTPKKKFGFFCLCRNNERKEFENQRYLLGFSQRKATRHFVVSFVFIAIFVQANEQKLWFGRDYFGRRSLLWHLPTDSNDVLAVTSVTERNSSATDKLVFISFSFLFFSLTFHVYPFLLA